MIAEIVPQAYDAVGRQVSQPFLRRKGPHPTFPMGLYVSQRLTFQCRSLEEVRQFLLSCRPASDQELFGREDYWQPPEEFERRKAGDCEDFSLWTWRQSLAMEVDARIVFGRHGRYGIGHAWVEYKAEGKWYLLEPQYCWIGSRMPRLSTFRYEPKLSVSWDGERLKYFAHQKPGLAIGWRQLAPLVAEYVIFWSWFWMKNCYRFPRIVWSILQTRVLRRELWFKRKKRAHRS